MKQLLLALWVTAGALTAGGTAQALPFVEGQVFASVGNGQIKVFNPDGSLVQTLNTGGGDTFTTGSAFDSLGDFYVTGFSTGNVYKFDSNGNALGVFANIPGDVPESVVFDSANNIYVGTVDGTNDIYRFNPAGTPTGQFNVATEARGSDWIDLAANQSTIFYTSEGRQILRFNTTTSTQLADFATLPGSGPAFALRLLRSGGLLVADSNDVLRLDNTGAVVQTYDAPGLSNAFALNVDPDGTSFWTGDIFSGTIFRFDIATGNLITSFESAPNTQLAGLSVLGEITVIDVPVPATLALISLGLAVLMHRVRRRNRALIG